MALAQSKVTAQGQISIPAEVRRRLGIIPGSILEWEEDGGKMTVRRAGGYTFEDIHNAIFHGKPPKFAGPDDVKEGIRRYVRKRYARS